MENCTGLNGIPDEALKPKEKDRKDGMTNLVSVTLPENITKIGKQAFCHCTRLTTIVIPQNVTSIGDYAFEDCNGLTTIVIPQNVTFIGDYAFKGCNSMETITLQCTTPPELDKESFSKVHVFYVPESAVDTYKNDQKWKKFAKKITAIGTELIEEPEIEEILKFNNLTIEAHEDGTITIGGTITTNTKLKEFCLYQENGNIVVYDFLNHNTVLKEKNSEFDENEMASKEKQYTLDITSAPIPVDIYQLSIKTKKGKVYSQSIGERYSFLIGSNNSTIGAFFSITNGKCYTLEEAKVIPTELVSVSSNDGNYVIGLKKATSVKNKEVAAKANKVILFNENMRQTDEITQGHIITESGCICKIYEINNTAEELAAKIETAIFRNNEYLKVISNFESIYTE